MIGLLLGLMLGGDGIPPVKREFRGVWVATVANIDWPSEKGLPAEKQQQELTAILDRCVALNLNAVVLQVRPMCDALYASKLEPWSEYLSGRLGTPPSPYYDPLEFAVKEAHLRGLELHAWFNPYRAHQPTSKSPIPADHWVKKHPDLAPKYGKHHWLLPTSASVQEHSLAVILDVVKRYDIDGIHLDDYFYPYAELDEKKNEIPFPDDEQFKAYQRGGGKLERDDWRRDAVNSFVKRMYERTKAARKEVLVGISPFGIWRPGNPPGIKGFDQYARLYADARLWLREGWIDYWTPQLYWPIAREAQSYPKLLGWWAGENAKGRHLWPGNIPSRVTGGNEGWPAKELADQIAVTRKQPGATGNVHFSMKPLMRNSGGVADAIGKMYAEPALPPASPWLFGATPPAPRFEVKGGKVAILSAESDRKAGARHYAIAARTASGWTTRPIPASKNQSDLPDGTLEVAVAAIDRVGNQSAWAKGK
jgi:uncharacterized lipoprotein YddW (UPF0748 family)